MQSAGLLVRRARNTAPMSLLVSCLVLGVLAVPAQAIEFTTDTTILSTDYPGQPIIVTGCTLTIDCTPGEGNYDSIVIRSGGILTHPPESPNGLWLNIANDVTVGSGTSINVTGKGHGSQGGPGGGTSGMGGTHGGTGGGSDRPVYGQILVPTALGSGGGMQGANAGGAGGGIVRMHIGGTLTVTGNIQAGGATVASAGGGSGGSISITTNAIAGSGSITAYGGNGTSTGLPAGAIGGGGGGGRVSVQYDTSTYSGTILTRGGSGSVSGGGALYGGSGCVYVKPTGGTPTLRFNGDTITGLTLHPSIDMPDVDFSVNNCDLVFDCTLGPARFASMLVEAGATLSHPTGNGAGLNVDVSGNVTVQSGAYIDASGRGHPAQAGPGGGASGMGGTHGGTGYGSDRAVYDLLTAPGGMGSGGGDTTLASGAAGGGVIRLGAGGTLLVTGGIVADGAAATSAGGGSGGSIVLDVGTLAGAGTIHAYGGNGSGAGLPAGQYGGGGGGGRVAVRCTVSTFSGSILARGGSGSISGGGAAHGGAGSVYREVIDASKELYFNGDTISGVTLHPAPDIGDAFIWFNNIQFVADCLGNPLRAGSLQVQAGATVSHPAGAPSGLRMEVGGDMTVQSGAYLDATGCGLPAQSGPGGGASGAGATHGGLGGGNPGGIYGSVIDPADLGSGGGNTGVGTGGAGGGFIHVSVGGTLTLTGTIAADGSAATGAGGGSGGSVRLNVGTFAGGGNVRAYGGNGSSSGLPSGEFGGGGGGGRVAVYYTTLTNSGSRLARGGSGSVSGGGAKHGGPGSVYMVQVGGPRNLRYDGDTVSGPTMCGAHDLPSADLVLNNCVMEVDCSMQPVRMDSLLVMAGATLTHPAGSAVGLQIETTGAATVQSGAYIDANACGYPSRNGPGAGGSAGEGGGYGGAGGLNTLTYGVRECPQDPGSGGGDNGATLGGAGGGRLRMLVGGTLTISGGLRANGQAATSAGGGSGGAILLVSGGVLGGGSVTANGGNGTGCGGGGGGRIASYSPPGTSKLPSGSKTVNGGTGAVNGAPGTIYTGDGATSVDYTFSVDGQSFGWDENGQGVLKAVVLNQGPIAADPVRVAVYDRDPALPGAVELGTVNLPGLPAHSAHAVEFSIDPITLTNIWVMADADNAVAEFDETNNKISLNATRVNTSLSVPDRTGTITENVALRGYLKRLTDNAWLPGRTVKFYVQGTYVGSAVTAADGKAELTWTITAGLASRTLQGKYAGEADYNPSQGTATLTCLSWTTKMVSFNRTARITDRTELKARLLRSDNAPIYGKTIGFYIDGTFIINRPTNVDGYASYPFYDVPDGAGAGVRVIRSDWAGNAGYAAISREATLTVLKAIPYIWVLSKSVTRGNIANLYAYFRRLYDYKKQEAKTVSFKIDGTWIADAVTGSGAFEPGVARYLYGTGGLSLGAHTIRCEFAGDAWLDAGYGEGTLTVY